MDRQRILLAFSKTADAEALRKLLTASGYEVKLADNGVTALQLCGDFRPHVVVAELQLQKIDGHHLLHELRSRTSTGCIPFILITKHRSVAERVHSISLGVDEYITSPFYPEEVMLRIELIVQEMARMEHVPGKHSRGFSGRLDDMMLVDLLQALRIGGKSAFVKVYTERDEGSVFMKQGELLNASLGDLEPKEALFRMCTWLEGHFRVELREIDQESGFDISSDALIEQGLAYRSEWHRIAAGLPPLGTRMTSGKEKIAALSPAQEALLQRLNGQTTVWDLIESVELPGLETLRTAAELYKTGLLEKAPDEPQANEDLTHKRQLRNRSERFIDVIEAFMNAGTGSTKERKIERRRKDRRSGSERRTDSRRLSDQLGQENSLHLNRTELLMIREKLANGQSYKPAGSQDILSTSLQNADR